MMLERVHRPAIAVIPHLNRRAKKIAAERS
jgi:hypothetical protein